MKNQDLLLIGALAVGGGYVLYKSKSAIQDTAEGFGGAVVKTAEGVGAGVSETIGGFGSAIGGIGTGIETIAGGVSSPYGAVTSAFERYKASQEAYLSSFLESAAPEIRAEYKEEIEKIKLEKKRKKLISRSGATARERIEQQVKTAEEFERQTRTQGAITGLYRTFAPSPSEALYRREAAKKKVSTAVKKIKRAATRAIKSTPQYKAARTVRATTRAAKKRAKSLLSRTSTSIKRKAKRLKRIFRGS